MGSEGSGTVIHEQTAISALPSAAAQSFAVLFSVFLFVIFCFSPFAFAGIFIYHGRQSKALSTTKTYFAMRPFSESAYCGERIFVKAQKSGGIVYAYILRLIRTEFKR